MNSSDFTQQSAFAQADLEWQCLCVHDERHGLVHLLGKPAGMDTAWKHQIYDIALDQWIDVTSTSGISGWNAAGHIYGNFTLDSVTGDIYVTTTGWTSSSSRYIHVWTYDSDYENAQWTWQGAPVNSGNVYTAAASNSEPNGIAFHPHLFGRNDPGIVFDLSHHICCWRKSTDIITTSAHSQDFYGQYTSSAVYWPAQNCVIIGGHNGGQLARVDAGTTPSVSTLSAPPIGTYAGGSGSVCGSLHVHPGNPNKLILLELRDNERAWESSDGNSWSAISGGHPFTTTPRVPCSLRGALGCFWAIGLEGSTPLSKVWRPTP